MSVLNLAEFIATGPCIEEMQGYRDALIERGEWNDEDQAGWLKARDRLMSGKEMPRPSHMDRAYIYQRGKKAKLKPRRRPGQ